MGVGESEVREDRQQAAILGQALSARYVVAGRAGSFGDKVTLHMRVLDVKALRWTSSVWTTGTSVEDLPTRVAVLLKETGLLAEKRAVKRKVGARKKTAPKPKRAPVPAKPEELVKMLASPDAGTRFTAVVKLGDTDFAGAVEPLLKTLKDDKDTFVRRAAARTLSRLHAVSAVPVLIDTLADPEYFVAVSCHKALIDLTRHDFGFEENMSKKQVKALVEKARVWWRQNEDQVKARRKK
jgi:hypothetical protein